MSVSIWQATLFGIFACLASLPGMGGTVVGNYTLGRPLVGGLICGLIMGDVATGIIAGAAIQIVYIALITPGGAVAADVRAISYIGVPLSIIAITNIGLTGAKATSMATALGSTVGTLGTVLMYGTATMNLIWQAYGWKCLESGKLKKLYAVDGTSMDLTYYLFLHSDIYHYIFRIRHDQSYPDLPSNGWSFHDDDLNTWKPSSLRRYCNLIKTGSKPSDRYSDLHVWIYISSSYGM